MTYLKEGDLILSQEGVESRDSLGKLDNQLNS